jgi:hypothetical protein
MKDTNLKEFNAWYEAEKAKGLVDIKFFIADDIGESTLESFTGEALAMLTATGTSALPEGF